MRTRRWTSGRPAPARRRQAGPTLTRLRKINDVAVTYPLGGCEAKMGGGRTCAVREPGRDPCPGTSAIYPNLATRGGPAAAIYSRSCARASVHVNGSPEDTHLASLAGQTFEKYEVLDEVGHGGMAVVYAQEYSLQRGQPSRSSMRTWRTEPSPGSGSSARRSRWPSYATTTSWRSSTTPARTDQAYLVTEFIHEGRRCGPGSRVHTSPARRGCAADPHARRPSTPPTRSTRTATSSQTT